jgi:hypothetical protein
MMSTLLLMAFLVAHGLLHLAIWMPHPQPDPDKPPPFEPDHSVLLTATALPRTATHQLSVGLAVGAAATYVLAGIAVAMDAAWVAPAAVCAAVLGLLLKAFFFHPWLTLGVLLDAAVLSAALLGWPVTL